VKKIKKLLEKYNIEPSFQRIKIYQYLIEKKNHPTVNIIYQDLKGEIPTLSKTTVYNNMKLFVVRNLVSVVTIEKNETRYDANTSLHGHFKCKKCEQIYDFKVDLIDYHLDDFLIEKTNINYIGICKKCRQHKEE
jgi:Fur family peroxide stress response transcriptional regulator